MIKPHASCTLIINPTSGKYSERTVRHVMESLSVRDFAPQLFITRTADEGPSLARQLCERDENPLIVVGGGDGTINGVANGLVPHKATLAVLPLGTANVLAKELGIMSMDDALTRIIRGETREFAAGLVKGEGGERRFLLMAGIGFDARVVHQTRSAEKKVLKQGAYLLAGLRCLRSWERELLHVTVDDGEPVACHSVVICNAASYGGTFKLAPEAELFTPGFEVVCVIPPTRRALFEAVAATLMGKAQFATGVRRFVAGRLAVSGNKPVQIDGDSWGTAPIRIQALEGFARIIV